MEICLISIPLQPTKYHKIQDEYLNDFYKMRLANFGRLMKNVDFNKLSDITTQNISLLTLSAYLKSKSKHKIAYFDMEKVSLDELPKSDVYAFSSFSCNYSITREIAKKIKKIHPNSMLVIGGPHATFMDEDIIKDHIFDFVIRGQGEMVLNNLIDAITNKKEFGLVKGITFICEGRTVRTEDETKCMESVMIPDYSQLKGYLPTARVFTSRGCPYRCAFCANNAMRNNVIHKETKDVKKELDLLYSKFGTRLFYIGDETFTLDKNRALNIINIMESFKDDAYWIFQTRPDRLSKVIIERLKSCKKLVEINIGIENVVDSVLKKNNKNLTYSVIYDGLLKLKKTGKNVLGYWMIGLPGETKETITRNIDSMRAFLKDGLLHLIEIGCFIPYPGTDIFKNQKKYGICIESFEFDGYTSESIPPYKYPDLSSEDIFNSYMRALKEVSMIYKQTFKKEKLDKNVDVNRFDKGLF